MNLIISFKYSFDFKLLHKSYFIKLLNHILKFFIYFALLHNNNILKKCILKTFNKNI